MADLQSVLSSPSFQTLDDETRRRLLREQFGVADDHMDKILSTVTKTPSVTTPSIKSPADNIGGPFTVNPNGPAALASAGMSSGVLQGVGSTVLGLGKLVKSAGGLGELSPQDKSAFDPATWGLVPTTVPQKVGNTAEKIAEFVGGSAAMKLPKATSILGNALKTGLETSAIASAQTGDVNEGVKTGAVAAAGVPVMSMGGAALQALAPKMINSVLKVGARDYNFGKVPSDGILKEGIVANTQAGLVDAVKAKKNEVGQLISENVNQIDPLKTISMDTILAPLKELKDHALKGGNAPLAKGIGQAEKILKQQWPADLTPQEAWQMKQAVGDNIVWTEDAVQKGVNEAKTAIYRGIRTGLEQASPGLKELNKRYSNLVAASYSADKFARAAAAKGFTPSDPIVAGMGALGGLTQGGGVETLGSALAALAAKRIATSPAFVTRAAPLAMSAGKVMGTRPDQISQAMAALIQNGFR